MGMVTMDALTESTTLVSRLGPQSWHFFVALQIETEWLSEPVSNDSTERMIKRTSDYSNFGAENEDDFQAILTKLKKRQVFLLLIFAPLVHLSHDLLVTKLKLFSRAFV